MTTLTADTPASTAQRDMRRADRFAARRTLWRESSLSRVRHCGSSLSKHTGDGQHVSVKLSEGVAGLSGLQSCGSPWSCPVCSQKIAASRAVDVQTAVSRWHDRGGRIVFMTLTMRHNRGQRLDDLWGALSYAWGRVTSGRGWVDNARDYGTLLPRTVKTGKNKGAEVEEMRIPYVRAVEVTHGAKGWHVHIHSLLFVRYGVTDADLEALEGSVFARWSAALTKRGLDAPARKITDRRTGESRSLGVDVRLVRRGDSAALGDYFTKSVYVGRVGSESAGWEIVGGSGKTARAENRTPFQILADVVGWGDADGLAQWWEFEAASKGKRQLTWSVGLRDLLDMGAEATDEEIAEEELGGDVVMTFDVEEWRLLRWNSCRVLSLVEDGADKALVMKICSRLRDQASGAEL